MAREMGTNDGLGSNNWVVAGSKTRSGKPLLANDPRVAQAVQNYEVGLRAMQEHKFEKAKGHLQKVLTGPSPELADRARTHLNTCNQHMERAGTPADATAATVLRKSPGA